MLQHCVAKSEGGCTVLQHCVVKSEGGCTVLKHCVAKSEGGCTVFRTVLHCVAKTAPHARTFNRCVRLGVRAVALCYSKLQCCAVCCSVL